MKLIEILKALDEGRTLQRLDTGDLYKMVQGEFCNIHVSGNTRYGLGLFMSSAGGMAVYEEPGNDWAWAKARLREATYVKRRSWVDNSIFYHHDNHLIYMEMDGVEGPYVTDLGDQDATDWVLA